MSKSPSYDSMNLALEAYDIQLQDSNLLQLLDEHFSEFSEKLTQDHLRNPLIEKVVELLNKVGFRKGAQTIDDLNKKIQPDAPNRNELIKQLAEELNRFNDLARHTLDYSTIRQDILPELSAEGFLKHLDKAAISGSYALGGVGLFSALLSKRGRAIGMAGGAVVGAAKLGFDALTKSEVQHAMIPNALKIIKHFKLEKANVSMINAIFYGFFKDKNLARVSISQIEKFLEAGTQNKDLIIDRSPYLRPYYSKLSFDQQAEFREVLASIVNVLKEDEAYKALNYSQKKSRLFASELFRHINNSTDIVGYSRDELNPRLKMQINDYNSDAFQEAQVSALYIITANLLNVEKLEALTADNLLSGLVRDYDGNAFTKISLPASPETAKNLVEGKIVELLATQGLKSYGLVTVYHTSKGSGTNTVYHVSLGPVGALTDDPRTFMGNRLSYSFSAAGEHLVKSVDKASFQYNALDHYGLLRLKFAGVTSTSAQILQRFPFTSDLKFETFESISSNESYKAALTNLKSKIEEFAKLFQVELRGSSYKFEQNDPRFMSYVAFMLEKFIEENNGQEKVVFDMFTSLDSANSLLQMFHLLVEGLSHSDFISYTQPHPERTPHYLNFVEEMQKLKGGNLDGAQATIWRYAHALRFPESANAILGISINKPEDYAKAYERAVKMCTKHLTIMPTLYSRPSGMDSATLVKLAEARFDLQVNKLLTETYYNGSSRNQDAIKASKYIIAEITKVNQANNSSKPTVFRPLPEGYAIYETRNVTNLPQSELFTYSDS